MMDTQKPLTSVYRILPFADAIFIGTSYRGCAPGRGDAGAGADTRSPIYHYADFYYSCIRSKFSTLKSVIFFYRLLEAWRVIMPLDVNL